MGKYYKVERDATPAVVVYDTDTHGYPNEPFGTNFFLTFKEAHLSAIEHADKTLQDVLRRVKSAKNRLAKVKAYSVTKCPTPEAYDAQFTEDAENEE